MKNTWVDFRAIKHAVTMQMILEHYSISKLRKSGDELRGRCPIHKGEGQDTFHVNVAKNAFHCFSCKARGNVLDLVAAMEDCSVREAAVKLCQWFSLSLPEPEQRAAQPAQSQPQKRPKAGTGERVLVNEPLKFQLQSIDYKSDYLSARGIPPELAEQFGIGFFSGRGSMHGRVVIPIHDEHGVLLAYAGRAVDDSEPKYKLPAGFHKSAVLYNLHRAVVDNQPRMVVVVEGFFDCLRVYQAGYPCVALMGCSLSAQQENLLVSHFSAAWLLLDGDEAGRGAARDIAERLLRQLFIKVVDVPTGKQPDMLSVDELTSLLK